MADPEPTDDLRPADEPGGPGDLGNAGKKALEAERKARRDAEKQLRDLEAKLKELEDKDKSESTKLAEKVAAAESRADEAATRLMRFEVGVAKGLTPAQTRRLVGVTREELEVDADELLATFKPDGPAPAKPVEDLRGGGEPAEGPEPDIRKIVESIPRGI